MDKVFGMTAGSYSVASFQDGQQLLDSKVNPCQSLAGPTAPHQRATLRCLVEGENEQRWMRLVPSFSLVFVLVALTVDDEPNDDNEDGYGYNSYDGTCGRSSADN